MTFGSAQILAFIKMRKTNRTTDQLTTTTPSSKPQVVGTKTMTSTDMRNHTQTFHPQHASHSISAALAAVPSTQQTQFVRVYPSSALPRYANRPTGSSRFRERLSLDMTAPKISAEQPRRLLESMIMVADMNGMTGDEGGKDGRQACVPQVKEVVSGVSNLIRSAVEVVRLRSRSPSPSSIGDSISDEEPFSVLAKLAGTEKLNMPRPPPPAAVCLQRSNAVRYRNRPRPLSRDQEYEMLCYHPGGEAGAYYLQDVGYGRPGRHSHSVPPNFANTNSQQWKGANVKGTTFSHAQCYALPPVGSPQYRSYADMVDDGAHPRLRVMNRTTTDSSPQSLSPNYGSFAAENTNFRAKLAASASLCYRTDIPDDVSVSSSSSWPDYPPYHVDRPDDVQEGISEAFRAARRFFSHECSIEEAVPAKSRFSLCSSSDSVLEAVPASRRFSMGEVSVEEVVPNGTRFPTSSASDGHLGEIGIHRWWANNTQPVDDNSSADADDEGDEENNSSFPYYVRHGPLRVRNASVSHSSEGSFPASAPTSWYYTQDSDETSEGNLADDDMAFYEELYEQPNPNNHSGSIDQSHFADFDGDFTDVPSLTNDTSPENSSRNESSSGRVLRTANQTSPQDGAGSENNECPSESESNDELPQRGRSRTRRAQ